MRVFDSGWGRIMKLINIFGRTDKWDVVARVCAYSSVLEDWLVASSAMETVAGEMRGAGSPWRAVEMVLVQICDLTG
jgi:hypothetical protein